MIGQGSGKGKGDRERKTSVVKNDYMNFNYTSLFSKLCMLIPI